MKMMFILVLTIGAIFAETTKWGAESSNGVSALTKDNFAEFVKTHPAVFVKFFAPWCGHCKTMAESYAALARKYDASDKEIVIAEVDATVHGEVATKYGVKGYPTLKFFVNGEPVDYKGAREADAIEEWIEKKLKVSLDEITTATQLAEVAKSKLAVVLYSATLPESLLTAFKAVAGNYESISFYTTKLAEAQTHATDATKAHNFVIFRNFEDGTKVLASDTELTTAGMKDFLELHRYASVLDFDEEAAQNIFGGQKTAIFFFSDSSSSEEEKAFNEVASSKKFNIVFSKSSISEGMGKRLADYIGITDTNDKEVRLVKFDGQDLQKFKSEAVTVAALNQFLNDFNAGNLKPYRKSEKPIENDTAPVKTIAGEDFDARVLESDQYVLLEVYAPWCGHCKQLAPIYEELAKKVAHNKKLVIAKMDGTLNEHPAISVKGFPTIKFYKRGQKDAALDYNGGRDLEGFLTYLKKELGNDWVEAGDVAVDEEL